MCEGEGRVVRDYGRWIGLWGNERLWVLELIVVLICRFYYLFDV